MEKSYQYKEILLPEAPTQRDYLLAAALYVGSRGIAKVRKIDRNKNEKATTQNDGEINIAKCILREYEFLAGTKFYEPCTDSASNVHEAVEKIANDITQKKLCSI